MLISENFRNFLLNSARLSFGNTIYLTTLTDVIYSVSMDSEILDEHKLNDEIIEVLNNFNNTDIYTSYLLLNGNDTINIYFDNRYNKDFSAQIILPVVINEKLFGALINTHPDFTFREENLRFAKTTLHFVQELLSEK